ncbi:MAG: hypothetical protein AB7I27_15910 [Bacteriovoracaceae bacterium]
MTKVWMLLLYFFSLSAFAQFTHIKLSPQFEQYLNQPKLKSLAPTVMALSSNEESTPSIDNHLENKIKETLLGVATKSLTDPIPTDGEEQSPLYEEIRNQLETSHESIAQKEVSDLTTWNNQFNFGNQNYSGFSWQKPFGTVQVHVDRQVAPNLMGDNWLVSDTFNFQIEATTFLEKLKDAGLASMSEKEIGAFAGITFKRTYTYYHYAPSYMDGLKSDFSKLFLPFLKFNPQGILKMGNEEIIKREDHWTAQAGGLISTPSSGASFSAGVLAEYAYQQASSIQSFLSNEKRFELDVKSKTSKSIGTTLSLQIDFFKLLKLTILNYDLNYEYAAGKTYALSFTNEAWQSVQANATQNQEFNHIMKGHGQIQTLEPYVIRLDESSSSSIESRGSILIWGKLNKSKTEQVKVIKDQVVKVFYKNYSQSIKLVQNIFSRLFSAVIYKLFKLPVGVKNIAMFNRQITLEYEASTPQAINPEISRIENTDQFSFVLTQSYEAARTDRWLDRRFKNDVIWFIDVFTTLPKDYKAIVRNEELKGPILVESNLRIEKNGFDFFISLPQDQVKKQIETVCDKKSKCIKNLDTKYQNFKNDYIANNQRPSLAKFKIFLSSYYKLAQSLTDLFGLFGEGNIFLNGKLEAQTAQGTPFLTSFSSGQFRGLGVIDNFKRSTGSRMPASIVSE